MQKMSKKTEEEQLILQLASKGEGITRYELENDHNFSRATAENRLKLLTRKGLLFSALELKVRNWGYYFGDRARMLKVWRITDAGKRAVAPQKQEANQK